MLHVLVLAIHTEVQASKSGNTVSIRVAYLGRTHAILLHPYCHKVWAEPRNSSCSRIERSQGSFGNGPSTVQAVVVKHQNGALQQQACWSSSLMLAFKTGSAIASMRGVVRIVP